MTTLSRARHSFDAAWNAADAETAQWAGRLAKARASREQAHANGGHDGQPDPKCSCCEDERKARFARVSAARARLADAILRNPSLLDLLRR